MKCERCIVDREVVRTFNLPGSVTEHLLECGHRVRNNPDRGEPNADIGVDVTFVREITNGKDRIGLEKFVKSGIDMRATVAVTRPAAEQPNPVVADSRIAAAQVGKNHHPPDIVDEARLEGLEPADD